MYDLKNMCWSKMILDRFGIDETKLPELGFAGSGVGKVLPDVREKLGLSEDCIVALGAQDQKCAALAAGLSDGTVTVSLGTAAAITRQWREADTSTDNGVGWCAYTKKGVFVTEGVIGTAGTCLRWVRDMLFAGEDYAAIDKEAKDALERGSSLIFHPYMNGPTAPRNYPESVGNFYGVNLATKRGDIALAVMEGVAFGMRSILETMNAYENVHTLVLFGGGAKSELWCGIIADATGMNIRVPKTHEAAGAGAAILAANGAGDRLSPLEAGREYAPSQMINPYEEKYKKYREIEKKLWEGEVRL